MIHHGCQNCWRSLRCQDLHEATLEFATVVGRADPGTEDEGGTRWENHVVGVHRALDLEVTESPYMAH